MRQKVCVLTGEGARGGFQAGIIKMLFEDSEVFDRFVGISSGAVMAFLFSQIKPEAIYAMMEETDGIEDVFSFSIWATLFGEGFYKAKPLRRQISYLLKNHRLDEKDRKECEVAFCDMSYGRIIYKEISKLDDGEIEDLVVRAVSIPGIVHPEEVDFCDAGVFEINPFTREMSKEDPASDITIISGKDLYMPYMNMAKIKGFFKIKDRAMRALDIIMYAATVDDFSNIMRKTEGFKYANVECFSYSGPYIGALEFNKSRWLFENATDYFTYYDKTDIEAIPTKKESKS